MLQLVIRISRIANVASKIQTMSHLCQHAQSIHQLKFVAAETYQQLPSHQHGHGTAHAILSIQVPLSRMLHSRTHLVLALNQMLLTKSVDAALTLNNKELPWFHNALLINQVQTAHVLILQTPRPRKCCTWAAHAQLELTAPQLNKLPTSQPLSHHNADASTKQMVPLHSKTAHAALKRTKLCKDHSNFAQLKDSTILNATAEMFSTKQQALSQRFAMFALSCSQATLTTLEPREITHSLTKMIVHATMLPMDHCNSNFAHAA